MSQKRALFILQRDWGIKTGVPIASHFLSKGYEVGGVTLKRSIFDSISTHPISKELLFLKDFDSVINDPLSVDGVNDISLQEICTNLGIDSIWPLSQERMFVRDYKKKYYYSFRQNKSDYFISNYFKACYLFFNSLISDYDINIIIGRNYASTFQSVYSLICDKKSIPTISLETSNVPGWSIFTDSYKFTSQSLVDKIESFQLNPVSKSKSIETKKLISLLRNQDKWNSDHDNVVAETSKILKDQDRKSLGLGTVSIYEKLKSEIRVFYYAWVHRKTNKRNFLKNIGPTIDSMSLKLLIRDYFAHKTNLRKSKKVKYNDFNFDDYYAYFPLQFQPEATTDLWNPWLNNQIETSRILTQAMPGDFRLVVKEHPAMLGRRSYSFYEKLLKSPNVVLVDPYNNSHIEIIKNSRIVITSSITTSFEAALHKKPCIQISDILLPKLLPNVIQHDYMKTMPTIIKKHLNLDTNNIDYEESLENYVSAITTCGVNSEIFNELTNSQNIEKIAERFLSESERLLINNGDLFNE